MAVAAVLAVSPAAGATASPARALCAGTPRTTGTLADPALTETSGLAFSRAHRGVLWAHNDSGDDARVFAVGRDGAALGTVTVTGAAALDWEDVALGPGPGSDDHLFLGDVGGGGGVRPTVTVFRIPEPAVPGPGVIGRSAPAAALTLRYPDGAHDAEALLVDGRTGDLVVVTKGADAPATVYRAAGATTAAAGSTTTLEAVGPIARPADPGPARRALDLAGFATLTDLVTGADASPTAGVAVVRTYGGIAAYPWPNGTTLADTLVRTPCAAPAPLDLRAPQGEAIALAPNGRRLVTVSEGVNAPLVELRARWISPSAPRPRWALGALRAPGDERV